MIGIDLFSGAGGMSLGASMTGIKVRAAVEMDENAALTHKFNHPESLMINKDIREINDIPIKVLNNEKKVLFGGPPCQGFSRSNQRTRNKENPNNWLFQEFLRISKKINPDWIVIENVEGMVYTEGGMFLEKIITDFTKEGYNLTYKVLNAKDFGVPQNRERLFIIGSLHGEKYSFPQPSNSIVTVKQALSGLPNIENGNKDSPLPYKEGLLSKYASIRRGNCNIVTNNGVSTNSKLVLQRYKYIPQGGNWRNIPIELMQTYKDHTRCHSGIYRRLDETKPSGAIGNYRKNMLIHPKQNRGLSVREAARLQSYPDKFEFLGYLGSQQQQVGNSVPPILAQKVFENIK